MNRAILVPLDGSNTAEMVIPYVEEMAAKLGARIALATVSESRNSDTAKISEAYLKRLEEQARAGVKDRGGQADLKISSTVLFGNPAGEINHHAQGINAGLIIMAGSGTSGVEHGLLGSIASKVVRSSARPVLLVKVSPGDQASRDKKLIKKILVPLDRSTTGEAAIPYVEDLAQGLSADLVLFHVDEPPVQSLTDPDIQAADIYSAKRERAAIQAYLTGVEKRLKDKGLNVSTVSESGAPADLIIDYAQENGIDLIAMSTHGRSGIGRWLLGSVTEKVINAGNTPVLVVRASKA